MKIILINKIRNFIIGFRFKKYGHFKTRLDEFKQVRLLAVRELVRSALCALIAGCGAAQVAAIRQTPVKTKKEIQQKALAIAQSIIDTNITIMKVYANY